ncbi:MAG TPA: arsenosugar biosynthesis radical SAM (seleno)protein ArsS [Thermodesulfobacteriota bacterium]|nr:arsenosugar biosynthesis radical SAM (seleno)protein ArsS [Thermodesulfobacteriota bacterium]
MSDFEKQIGETTGGSGLFSQTIEILQVNLGLRCNQQCYHCHLEASPERTERMDWPLMERVLEVAPGVGCRLVDLTGGAPELNPHFSRFVSALRSQGHEVQVRTNLTVLSEPGLEEMPEFFRENRVRLVASLPCYLEENVRAQRGEGVFEKSVKAIQGLNALGYGFDPDLSLNLVYNPGGPFLPPPQLGLEEDYRRELGTRFGITFTSLLTITNMPLGRFRMELDRKNEEKEYLQLLQESFNPQTMEGLMCRHQISIGWDGTLYDCDFNLALGLPVNHGAPDHIRFFRIEDLVKRRIVTGEHCFGCAAGAGSSCGGALLQ